MRQAAKVGQNFSEGLLVLPVSTLRNTHRGLPRVQLERSNKHRPLRSIKNVLYRTLPLNLFNTCADAAAVLNLCWS